VGSEAVGASGDASGAVETCRGPAWDAESTSLTVMAGIESGVELAAVTGAAAADAGAVADVPEAPTGARASSLAVWVDTVGSETTGTVTVSRPVVAVGSVLRSAILDVCSVPGCVLLKENRN
jgi:hypothetical protein